MLRKLLRPRQGKKNGLDEHLIERLTRIKGVGPEYAERLVKVYGSLDKIRGADDLEKWLPDHVASKIKKSLR